MKKETAIVSVKIPLTEALNSLAQIQNHIEVMNGEIPDSLIPDLNTAESNLTDAVDRRIYLIDSLNSQINYLDSLVKYVKDKKEKLEKAKEKIMNDTAERMKAVEIKEIKGSIRSFKFRQKGGVEAIKWLIEFNKVDNVINEEDFDFVPAEFIEEKTIKIVDKKALSEHIRKVGELHCAKKEERESYLAIV